MGHFEKYTVDDIREIVEYDRPAAMNRQAAAWAAMSALLAEHATGLRAKADAVGHSWTGRTATGIREELGRAEAAMRDAADVAVDNSHGWAEIAVIADWARDEVIRVHSEWCAVKATPPEAPDPRFVPPGIDVVVGEPRDHDAMREPFDRAARAVMDAAAERADELHHRYLAVPAGYRPPDSLPPIGSGPTQPSKAGGAASEGGEGDEGSREDPMLQGSAALHTSVHGYGPGPGATPGASGGGPVLASAPVRPVAADGNGRTVSGTDGGGRGARFSRAPKPYTGDSTSHRGLVGRPAEAERPDAEVERLSRRAPQPEEDDPWRSAPTTPAVITGAGEPEPPFHDPGTVIGGR